MFKLFNLQSSYVIFVFNGNLRQSSAIDENFRKLSEAFVSCSTWNFFSCVFMSECAKEIVFYFSSIGSFWTDEKGNWRLVYVLISTQIRTSHCSPFVVDGLWGIILSINLVLHVSSCEFSTNNKVVFFLAIRSYTDKIQESSSLCVDKFR